MWSCLGVCMLQQLAVFTHLFSWVIFHCGASLVAQMINNLLEMQETQLPSLGREDSMERKWLPTPVFFPGESHGHRSLAVYCPWAPKELDMTEWLTTHTHTQYSIMHVQQLLSSFHIGWVFSLLPYVGGSKWCCPWNFLGKNTGMGCQSLFQGIFPTQGLNPGLCISGRFFIIWTICLVLGSLYLYCYRGLFVVVLVFIMIITNLHFHGKCRKLLFPPHSIPQGLFLDILRMSLLTGGRWVWWCFSFAFP